MVDSAKGCLEEEKKITHGEEVGVCENRGMCARGICLDKVNHRVVGPRRRRYWQRMEAPAFLLRLPSEWILSTSGVAGANLCPCKGLGYCH